MSKVDPTIQDVLDVLSEFGVVLGQVKGDVGTLKSDVQVLKSDVKVLKSDVKVLKSDVQVLKSDVKQLKSDMQDVREEQERQGKQLDLVAQKVTENQKMADTRLKALESRKGIIRA